MVLPANCATVAHNGRVAVNDERFTEPLLTKLQAARHLVVPRSTVTDWAARSLIHVLPSTARHAPTMPLAAVAETQVLRGLKAWGLNPREVAAAARRLRKEFGPYGVINQQLATDGAHVLRELAEAGEIKQWERVVDGQLLLPEVVDDHIHYIDWAPDGYPLRLRLRSYKNAGADVVLDPRFGYGDPVFARTKTRVTDVTRLFLAGEPLDVICEEYDLTQDEVLAAIRVLSAERAVA